MDSWGRPHLGLDAVYLLFALEAPTLALSGVDVVGCLLSALLLKSGEPAKGGRAKELFIRNAAIVGDFALNFLHCVSDSTRPVTGEPHPFMPKPDVQLIPSKISSTKLLSQPRINLQITFLNVTDALPGNETFADKSIKVLLKNQTLENRLQIRHSSAVTAS